MDSDEEEVKEEKKEEPLVVVKEESVGSDSDFDNEEEGGQWVTNDNLYSHISGASGINLLKMNIGLGCEEL